jgi:3-(3-hydroxy-phenyl)propionate hydroxylase
MPHSEHERFFPMYNLQQQYIEQFLAEQAEKEPLVDLRWQSRCDGFADDSGTQRLRIATPAGVYSLDADYVIAADGARSQVRDALGLKLEGEAYEGRYVIVDIKMKSDYPTERRAFFDAAATPGETVLVHKQPDDIWRIDYQLPEDADPDEALREECIVAKVSAIVDMLGEDAWDLEWWSLYRAYTLALKDYRHANVFFAGDAAHLVPIFGVRGLNSGFADAANIGWKLAYVLLGHAGVDLLDSYSLERRGATLEIFHNAAKSTRFMTPPTRGTRLMREAALELSISETFTRRLIDPRQSRPYIYATSPLTQFPDRDRAFQAGPPAGAALINQRTGPDHFLLDDLGEGFTGIYFADHDCAAEIAGLRRILGLAPQHFRLIVVDADVEMAPGDIALPRCPHIAAAYGASPGSFYLVRPDRHVCARWVRCVPEEVRTAIVHCLRGTAS